MKQISNSTASTGAISSEPRLGMTWAVTVGMVMLLIGTPVASAEQTATESVRSTMDEVIHEDMAKRALGGPWIELTDTERQEFVALFVQLLRDAFAGRIDN
jgi:phospholipid transport system substrate-binding protein